MPIHDWTRVEAGIFHHVYHDWISEIARALNRGLLPKEYYALAEQIAGGLGPDVQTLQRPANDSPIHEPSEGGVALADAPPQVWAHMQTEIDQYAAKANRVTIRHCSNHDVVAMVEIVSPGNKSSRHGLRAFVDKAVEALRLGVHLLIIDLFPPGPRDPQGLVKTIWDEFEDKDFSLPQDRPLTISAYIGGACPQVFVEAAAVGAALPKMPLFLTEHAYIPFPLEPTYQSAWEAFPEIWKSVVKA